MSGDFSLMERTFLGKEKIWLVDTELHWTFLEQLLLRQYSHREIEGMQIGENEHFRVQTTESLSAALEFRRNATECVSDNIFLVKLAKLCILPTRSDNAR
jgi:hypothetical protein